MTKIYTPPALYWRAVRDYDTEIHRNVLHAEAMKPRDERQDRNNVELSWVNKKGELLTWSRQSALFLGSSATVEITHESDSDPNSTRSLHYKANPLWHPQGRALHILTPEQPPVTLHTMETYHELAGYLQQAAVISKPQ